MNRYLEKIAAFNKEEASAARREGAKARNRRRIVGQLASEQRTTPAPFNYSEISHGGPTFSMSEPFSMPGYGSHEAISPTMHEHAPVISASTRGADMVNSMSEVQPTERYGKLRSRWNALAPATQKKLKIGGAIGGALALGGAGYAAMNHEKAASVALLINEGFSVDEAVALVGE